MDTQDVCSWSGSRVASIITVACAASSRLVPHAATDNVHDESNQLMISLLADYIIFFDSRDMNTYIMIHQYWYTSGRVKGLSRSVRAGSLGGSGVDDGGIDDGGMDEEYPAVTVGTQPDVGIVV